MGYSAHRGYHCGSMLLFAALYTGSALAAAGDTPFGLHCPELPSNREPQQHRTTVLIFYSPTCPPCKQAKPALNRIIDQYRNASVDFFGIDATLPEHQNLVQKYYISHTPTIIIITEQGSRLSSAAPKRDCVEFLAQELARLEQRPHVYTKTLDPSKQ